MGLSAVTETDVGAGRPIDVAAVLVNARRKAEPFRELPRMGFLYLFGLVVLWVPA